MTFYLIQLPQYSLSFVSFLCSVKLIMLSLQPRQLLSLITINEPSDVPFHSGMGKNILEDYLVDKNSNEKYVPIISNICYISKTGFKS